MQEHETKIVPLETTGREVRFLGAATGNQEPPSLEGVLTIPQDGALHPGVLIIHTNPAAGGNMDTGVMKALESAFVDQGFACLRYNSRGVGKSEGQISLPPGKIRMQPEGTPETADVGAALDFLSMQEGVNGLKTALVGHSFGSRISLAYLAEKPSAGIQAAVLIGLPVAWRDLSHLGQWPRPKLFVTGENDDFCPPDKLAAYTAALPEPKTMVTLKRTGHFFEGRERDLAMIVSRFLQNVFNG